MSRFLNKNGMVRDCCFLAAFLLLVTTSSGDSLPQCTLKGVSEVRIVILSAGLTYESIPTVDVIQLERLVSDVAAKAMAENKVEVTSDSNQVLEISLHKLKLSGREREYVVLIKACLREGARIDRVFAADRARQDSDFVTTWESWQWSQVTPANAQASIVESVKVLAVDFAQAVTRASGGPARSGEEPD